MKFDDATWEKWAHWIGAIKDDLASTVNDEAIFAAFRKLVHSNADWIEQHHGARFCRFVFRSYAARAALGIRRHTKNDKQAISLVRLLHQVRECAAQVSFEYYLKRFPLDPTYVEWQPATFRLLSTDGKTIAGDAIDADLAELRRLTGAIEEFADRVVAHMDPRGTEERATFDSMAEAIGCFNKLTCRYLAFFGGPGYATLESTVQFPWERIFTVPLTAPRQ